jgi:5-formyltetrahydrofolate cyclo-ligase
LKEESVVTDEPGAQKAALRDKMRSVRRAIPSEKREALAGQAEARLLGLDEVGAAATVLLFYSFGSEVATHGIGEHLLARGKRLLLPYLSPQGMEAAEVFHGGPLLPTGYGPREPSRRIPLDPAELDLIITPGLAFDRRGFRLGYGGGHYDRFLTRVRPDTIRIGLAFSVQLVDRVPEEPSDQKVHFVVTDAEIVDCRDGPDRITRL